MWRELGRPASRQCWRRSVSRSGEATPGESPIFLVRLVVEQTLLFLWNPCTSLFFVTMILVHPTITFMMIAAFPHRGLFRPALELKT